MKSRTVLIFSLALASALFACRRESPAKPAAHAGGHEQAPAKEMPGMEMKEGEASPAMPPGSVRLSPDRQQLLGVVLTTVERRPMTREIRTVGRVEYDERRFAFVNTKFAGWIERLDVDFTGVFVRKGQTLMAIYSPELVSAQEE